ncbi:MAG: UDP-N-acetylglucosamine diphosphorylase [Defluviitaleaceae bacterium]|nr:UDP-N-acetylglucosamine diphosphorylase [Defluviitaleaceae bacterium]
MNIPLYNLIMVGEKMTFADNNLHEKNGVVFWDKNNTYIGVDVNIGEGTVILPFCIVEGDTVIGKNCTIGANTHLIDMKIGDNVHIRHTVAEKSFIDDGCVVGPFAQIRPNTKLAKGVKIGNFVEVKQSVIGENSKANHLSYVGDAIIGNDVNIGCGTITVNYDGKNKHTTTIEDGVFVGCNANLIAPVTIGKNATVAAGSTISKNVPPNALAVARAKQDNKEGWVAPKNRG